MNRDAPAPPPAVAARWFAVRSAAAGSYLESWLIAAVASILIIRLYLQLTGYPRIGGGGLHIAHMLWGGVLMLGALTMLLAYLGNRIKRTAAIVGGVGFGTFIDELGKFITSDNNYFYQPTVGLLYVIFITLFLAFRYVERRRPLSDEEALVNAADLVREVALGRARREEVAYGLALLERNRSQPALAAAIRAALDAGVPARAGSPSLPDRASAAASQLARRLLHWRGLHRLIVWGFVLDALGGVLVAALVLLAASAGTLNLDEPRDLVGVGQLVAAVVAWTFVVLGVTRLTRSRWTAYRWFRRSVLVSIFFGQVFLFFESQFAALGGLAVDLVLLGGLDAMVATEPPDDTAGA